jgi:hypothetical protein
MRVGSPWWTGLVAPVRARGAAIQARGSKPARLRRVILSILLSALALAGAACGTGNLFGREYEYEEEIYLKVDGSATVVVNASLAALSALRGAPSFEDASGTVDRDAIRRFFGSPVTEVTRVSRPWTRHGRTFVQVRVATDDIRSLGKAMPFAWSTYAFAERGETVTFVQSLGAAVLPNATGPWQGNEIVAVRLHVPAKIQFHNAPSKQVERGNIVSWEQSLKDRLAGKPLRVEVRMERNSILAWTLTIFGASAAAAAVLFVLVIWWVRRKGRP